MKYTAANRVRVEMRRPSAGITFVLAAWVSLSAAGTLAGQTDVTASRPARPGIPARDWEKQRIEFRVPPGSQPSLEAGPASRAVATRPGDAIVPGQVAIRPTWSCLGINWHSTGDANRNARCQVEFRRKGTDPWRPALPLFLHDFEKTTMLSGSILRLCPGTEYEVRLSLRDPDGGGTSRTASARTLDYPRMPSKGKTVEEGGLAKAQELAEPGQVMVLPKGTYPAVALTKSGKPGQWIVYKAAKEGEVTIEGRIEVKADWVWLHGLVLRDKVKTIEGTGSNVCITGCNLSAHYCIHTPEGAENWFIADNTMTGDAGDRFTFDGEGVDLGADAGGGHAVCFNEITDTADGISYGGGNIDVYGNYIHETVDDCIEPDYARENYRVWSNLCYNSMCGFSFQPMKGGPWYFYDNIDAGSYLHALKVKRITGWTVLVGNTIVGRNPGLDGIRGFLRGLIEDNIWLRTTPGPLTASTPWKDEYAPTLIDYNAYSDPEVLAGIGYKALAEKQGWDKHSIVVDWRDVFAEPVKAPASQPYYSSNLQGKLLPKDWRFEHSLLLPKEGSKVIAAGTVLPNITGPYLGKAPDLGANQLGLGTAWHGPRYWDTIADLVYGIPKGWHSFTKDDPGKMGIMAITGAQAIVFDDSKMITAMFTLKKASGEARWDMARQLVADDTDALTPILEFQDGLLMRLYDRPRGLFLIVGRVEPDGVLHVEMQNRLRDRQAARTTFFQLARSLCR
jgi:hypothetical protein